MHNGKIDQNSAEVQDLFNVNQNKITEQCDIYSIGAILFRLLLGVAPDSEISRRINLDKMHLEDPEQNVFKVPFFLENRILSNEMCRILILMLHYDPEHRYESLAAVKEDLLRLRRSIFETPLLLRQILKHPILPKEKLDTTKL